MVVNKSTPIPVAVIDDGGNNMGTKRTIRKRSKTTETVTPTLTINTWINATPDAPPVNPNATVGARNYGRYSGKKCTVWQRWVMTDCRDDRRTDAEIAAIATIEFAASTHVVSHNGQFPLGTVRAMRNEYNRGIRGTIVDGPVPEWFINPDGTRYGMLRTRGDDGKLTPATPYEPPK